MRSLDLPLRRFYTPTKSWRGYIFIAVCLCVCLSVWVSVCVYVSVIEQNSSRFAPLGFALCAYILSRFAPLGFTLCIHILLTSLARFALMKVLWKESLSQSTPNALKRMKLDTYTDIACSPVLFFLSLFVCVCV